MQKGANKALNSKAFTLLHNIDSSIDVSIYLLKDSGKVVGDEGMIFYGSPNSSCNSVELGKNKINIDLAKLPSNITKIAIAATVDGGNFSSKPEFKLESDQFAINYQTAGREEAALILAEIYLRNNEWKIKNIDQGFNGGLKPLAEYFGVDIEEEPLITAPTAPKINLVKGNVNLRKGDKPVVIEKTPLITATVSWKSGTDYDIYALVMLADGSQIDVATFGAEKIKPLINYGNGKIVHKGDIKAPSGNTSLSTETLEIKLTDEIIAVVPVAYSAQSNGTGSFLRYKVSLAIDNGLGTRVDISAENANKNDNIYSCIPGIIYNKKEGVEIEYLELYSKPNSERRPLLKLNSDKSVRIYMDEGPMNDYK